LKIENIEEVMKILKKVVFHMQNQGIDQWDSIYPSYEIIRQDIEENTACGLWENGKICTYIAMNEKYDLEYDTVFWKIQGKFLVAHRLFIDPEHQGRGNAKTMMDFVENQARNKGYSSIRLDAFSQNPVAIRLYESRNYQRAGSIYLRKGLFFCYEKKI